MIARTFSFHARCSDGLLLVFGRPYEYAGFKFIVHGPIENTDQNEGYFYASEATTGRSLPINGRRYCNTVKDGIRRFVNKVGVETIKAAIEAQQIGENNP